MTTPARAFTSYWRRRIAATVATIALATALTGCDSPERSPARAIPSARSY